MRRLLDVDDRGWDATLVIPSGITHGVFADGGERFSVVTVGRAQPPGASQAGLGGAIRVATELFRQAWSIRRSRIFRNVDVVHANSTRSAVYAALALLGSKTPFVVHLRDLIEPDSIGTIGYKAFKYVVAPRATRYIANSAATAATVSDLLRSRQQVDVIASSIGIARADHVEPRPTDRPVRIGMVARLDSWKGQAEVLRAFQKAGLGGSAELIFFGDASFGKEDYAAELRDIAAQVPGAVVTFAGFVGDVQAAIDSVDICVQYSVRPEPLGQNVLQYLARGKAVIAAREGGPLEWVDDNVNGILVAPRDEAALAAALERLTHNADLRTRLGEAALETKNLPTDELVAHAHAVAFNAASEGR